VSQDPDVFDFVVIGSGPAGEKAAAHAAYFGKRVAVVERSDQVGGAPVGTAGVPTKTLRETALYLTGFRRADVYGVGLGLDPGRISDLARRRNDDVRATMIARVRENLERHGVAIVHGTARLGRDHSVLVRASDGSERVLRAEAVLLATGSVPFHPPAIPTDDPGILDSDSVVGAFDRVDSLLIVGAGPIGCEYASIFSALGTRVTLVDGGDRLLRMADHEVSEQLRVAFELMGVELLLSRAVEGVSRRADGLAVALTNSEVVRTQRVLVASGRAGTTGELGLEDAGIEVDAKGRIVVDERLQTTAPGVYAAGDVVGPPALASAAMEQGRLAASHAFATPYWNQRVSTPAMGVYSIPEVGMAGLTEQQAEEQGLDYAVGRAHFSRNTRATIAGATDGMVKLVFRRDDRRVLGVHIVGETAAEMVHIGQAVLQHGGNIDYFVHNTFNVPTWSEAYQYAAFDGLGLVESRLS
jgi:NAD(P) transhydrogenase